MTAEIKGKQLIITMDMIDPPRSSMSGKTLVVASSNGNHATTAQVKGKPIIIGVNAYIQK